MSFHSYTLQPYKICKQSGFGKFRPPDENDTDVKLIFDNSYSIFRVKNIRLAIQVKKYENVNNNNNNNEIAIANTLKKKKKCSVGRDTKSSSRTNSGSGKLSPKSSKNKGEKKKKKKSRVAMID